MACEYLLDTCIVSAAMKGQPRKLLNRLTGLAPERMHLSALVTDNLREFRRVPGLQCENWIR